MPAVRQEEDAGHHNVQRRSGQRGGGRAAGACHRLRPMADTSALEREIDQRVYRLYALTADEIKLVEEAAK